MAQTVAKLNPRAGSGSVCRSVHSLRADVCIASHSSGVTSSVTCRAAHPVRHLPRTPEAVPQWRARRFGVREAMVSGPCRAIVREQEPLKRQPALQLLRDHFHRTVVQLHAAPSACMCVVRAREAVLIRGRRWVCLHVQGKAGGSCTRA